ncbi:MAG: FeoB small GTPase domain-containing protein [Eubacteriales bacterium]|nr:FeoB small GTPase domain-containing protein [Eubacteriales bacterium]
MTTFHANSAEAAALTDSRPVFVTLAGSPGSGKTTVFHGLSRASGPAGHHQVPTDKPVSGTFTIRNQIFHITDLPGLYSLAAHSPEERTARDFLLSGRTDIILFVCDGVCLERGLSLLRQLLCADSVKEREIPVVLCINFCDEMERRQTALDAELLQDVLQLPVVCCCALKPVYIERLRQVLQETAGTRISYDCLDFSPAQLAREAVFPTDGRFAGSGSGEALDRMILEPVLGRSLFFLLGAVMTAAAAAAAYCADMAYRPVCAFVQPSPGAAGPSPGTLLFQSVFFCLAWAFSVLLPAAAVFLFLFGLAEAAGLLPRAAVLFCRSRDLLELPPCRRPRLRQVLPRLTARLLLLIPWLAALAVSAGIAVWMTAAPKQWL